MTTFSRLRLAALGAALILVGAGCPTPQPVTNTQPSRPNPTGTTGGAAPSPELGFGQLPRPTMAQVNSTSGGFKASGMMTTPRSAASAPVANMMAGNAGVATGAPGTTASMMRPLPIPYPNPRPVTVEYSIDGTLPSWNASGDVLQVERALPDADSTSAFVQNAGLPPQALDSSASITSINLQWKDTDNYQWSFDVRSRSVSFWKNDQTTQPNDGNTKPTYDKNAIIAAADAFLDAHGFSSIRQSGGNIDDQTWNVLMNQTTTTNGSKDAIYPCPMMGVGVSSSAVAPSASGASAGSGSAIAMPIKPGIMPIPPCGWWPQAVTVFYGGTRDGKPVVDTSGNPFRANSVTVAIGTNQVTGGNLQLEESVDRASYPFIDKDTATKRLQSGGLNPVWPWGSETKTITVHLTKLDVIWMRYDAWGDSDNQTYYLPALRATGTVDRGIKGQSPEPYTTLVPLVADSAFADTSGSSTTPPTPVPVPAVQGGMPIKGAPEPQVAPGSGPNIY